MEKTNSYIDRLIECGYTTDAAMETYADFINNFSIAELEVYTRYVEMVTNVDLLQS